MEKKCIICGKIFYPSTRNSIKRREKQKYCSLKCLWKSHKKAPVVKKCINCGNEFTVSRRESKKIREGRLYCSKSCAYYGSERNKKISKARLGKFTGEENGKWKGGISICNGYARETKSKKRINRQVMENYLGKKLRDNEIVHHINGNKLDNRIENLKVMTNVEHCKLHKENIKIERDGKGRIKSYKLT